ncbi:MAG: thioredoxin family protein [Bacteroidales bacterium]|nr:thioredoxin family protein [Bacteroidales bacterium]MCF8390311.1 thioredoxin family protein [Bacteroidales bacterium]
MKKYIAILILITLNFFSINAQFPMGDMDPVSWSFAKTDVGNGVVELKVSATIDEPWHMYAIEQTNVGPIPTSFSFEENENVEIVGEIKELIPAKIKFDEGFQFEVGTYSKKAEFTIKLKNNGSEEVNLKASVEYQCCDDETCLPPFTKDFSVRLKGAKEIVAKEKVIEESKVENSIIASESVTEDENVQENVVSEELVQNDEKNIEKSDVETKEKTDRSLFGFLFITFILGLAAILTPCVYPMIPMTISFFMRGEQKRSLVILKGLVFGFSMILVYTGLGVLVALTGMDANFGNVLSTHWIPNIIFFVLFMIFAASFLGMFELILPSGIVNKVDKQAERGGLIGPFFMGITTVLVSFSCTGPIVGSLLTEAAGGDVMKPILGMFFFSLAFALPFTLLAIFPAMLKNLPKSGGWMNTVKAVLGFMMLAFGMKFLSSMDQSYHLGIFTREIYLAIWFVIAVIMGFYLLGKIKFPHDSELESVSVPRLLLAMASFVFAIYVFTGIFGNDLKSISSMIPPKSSQNFVIGGGSGNSSDTYSEQSSTYDGPGRFDDIFHLPYGLKGYFYYEDGMAAARKLNKPVFLDFTGHSCSNCKQMESQVWSDPQVLQRLREEFVIISLYTDDKTKLPEEEWITTEEGKVLKTIGEMNVFLEIQKFKTFATPWYIIMDADENLLTEPMGKDLNVENFLDFLNKGLGR